MNPDCAVRQSQWKQWLGALAATSVMMSTTLDAVWATRRGYLKWEPRVVANASCIITGAILGAMFADICGRKKTLLLTTIFLIPRVASLNFVSEELSWINELFMDVGSGITCTVVPLYICEIADTNIRGTLMVLQLTVFTFGALVSEIATIVFQANHISHWIGIVNNALLIISTLFHTVILCILPETPHYLYWKKRYPEAAQSLAIFRGVDQVKLNGAASGVFINVQSNDEGHCWRKKVSGIIQFEYHRSLAMIFSLIVIKWSSGQQRNEYGLMSSTSKYIRESRDYFFICIWTVKLVFSIVIMLTIDVVERTIFLLFVIFGCCIATTILLTPLAKYYWIAVGSFSVPMLAHVLFTAVVLDYVGKFFSINVRAIASAAVICFEVTTRDVVFMIEELLYGMLMLPFCISGIVLFCASFLVFLLFPKTNHVPFNEITDEISEGRGNAYCNE